MRIRISPYLKGHGPTFTIIADETTFFDDVNRPGYRIQIRASENGKSTKILDHVVGGPRFGTFEPIDAMRSALSFFSCPTEESTEHERELAKEYGEALTLEFEARFGSEAA